jgi:hypothetical protein
VLEEQGYVFSRDGFGELPWIPNTVSVRFAAVAEAVGVDATIRSAALQRDPDADGRDRSADRRRETRPRRWRSHGAKGVRAPHSPL